jgi:DNA-binding transcriptional LysR family regulator
MPRSTAEYGIKEPPNAPIAVLAADAITTFHIMNYLSFPCPRTARGIENLRVVIRVKCRLRCPLDRRPRNGALEKTGNALESANYAIVFVFGSKIHITDIQYNKKLLDNPITNRYNIHIESGFALEGQMEFRHLRYFVYLVDSGSYVEASQKLHISQPALSKIIKDLENNLSGELIDRASSKRELTDLGKFIYQHAKKLVVMYEEFIEEYSRYANIAMGSIRVGIPPVLGTCVLSTLIQDFSTRFPRVQIVKVEEGAKIVQHKVLADKLGLGFSPLPLDDTQFEYHTFFEDVMDIIVHKNHRLAAQPSIALSELKDENFVLLDENFVVHDNIIDACRKAGFIPRIISESSNWDYLLELVSTSKCVTILPKPITDRYSTPNLKKIPEANNLLHWDVAIFHKRGKELDFAAKKFMEFTLDFYFHSDMQRGKP